MVVLAWLAYVPAITVHMVNGRAAPPCLVAVPKPIITMDAVNGRAAPPSLTAEQRPIITIFSLDTCKPCQAAKKIFDKLGLPYTDISITKFPERRDDAHALVPPGVTSMPQIFFGEHRVGGASDLAALIHQPGGRSFYALYAAAQPTSDIRKRPAISTSLLPPPTYHAPQMFPVAASPPPLAPRIAVTPAPTYAEYLASKSSATDAVPTSTPPLDSRHVPLTRVEVTAMAVAAREAVATALGEAAMEWHEFEI